MTSAGVLHTYSPGLVAFEHIPPESTSSSNKVLFVGGLGDGLFTVPFVHHLLNIKGWGIIEIMTSSSYKGWGLNSVKQDAEEIARAVKYFRNSHKDSKLVLMGHSTGSQDTFQYLLNTGADTRTALNGAILQAPVSDREFIVNDAGKTAYLTSLSFCESWIKDGRGQEIIPRDMRPGFTDTPVCAERWFSLAAPLGMNGKPQGSEDFFSSDIDDSTLAETFGKLPKGMPLLVLYSGEDQFVPEFVDKEGLVKRWRNTCEAAGVTVAEEGGIVPGATHNLGGVSAEVIAGFVSRIEGFLGSVATGESEKLQG